jgi:hypothetical protein
VAVEGAPRWVGLGVFRDAIPNLQDSSSEVRDGIGQGIGCVVGRREVGIQVELQLGSPGLMVVGHGLPAFIFVE